MVKCTFLLQLQGNKLGIPALQTSRNVKSSKAQVEELNLWKVVLFSITLGQVGM